MNEKDIKAHCTNYTLKIKTQLTKNTWEAVWNLQVLTVFKLLKLTISEESSVPSTDTVTQTEW